MSFQKILSTVPLAVFALFTTLCAAGQSTASFTLQLNADSPTFRIGEVIRIEIIQTNVSVHSVNCDYAGGNAVNKIYDYYVTREDGSPADKVVWSKPVPPPSRHMSCEIGPKDSQKDWIHLSNVYKFDKPGSYTVRVSRVDPDTNDESGNPVKVYSNTITITITG
jgi:hypothetical protein